VIGKVTQVWRWPGGERIDLARQPGSLLRENMATHKISTENSRMTNKELENDEV